MKHLVLITGLMLFSASLFGQNKATIAKDSNYGHRDDAALSEKPRRHDSKPRDASGVLQTTPKSFLGTW